MKFIDYIFIQFSLFFHYFKIREHFYSELKTVLLENSQYLHTEIDKELQEQNMHNVAISLEYKIFCNSKIPNKYKFDISKLVCNIL